MPRLKTLEEFDSRRCRRSRRPRSGSWRKADRGIWNGQKSSTSGLYLAGCPAEKARPLHPGGPVVTIEVGQARVANSSGLVGPLHHRRLATPRRTGASPAAPPPHLAAFSAHGACPGTERCVVCRLQRLVPLRPRDLSLAAKVIFTYCGLTDRRKAPHGCDLSAGSAPKLNGVQRDRAPRFHHSAQPDRLQKCKRCVRSEL